MLHCLVMVSPLHASGERRSVYAASASLRDITGLAGKVWEPALIQAPTLQMSLFNGDFQEPPSPGAATLPLQMGVLKHSYPWADDCVWGGAPVEIRVGEKGEMWPWRLIFAGSVNGYERKAETLTLTAQVDFDDRDVMVRTYAGTGGAEGPIDLAGKAKPLAIGWPRNIQPLLIDAVNSVYQFSGYGPIEAVTTLYERGADFGASTGNHASYAALVAATIAPGKWATCLAEGLIRLGAPEYGVVTGDIKGHVVSGTSPRQTGAILTALAAISGIDPATLLSASLADMDVAVPHPVSLVITSQIKFLEVARRMVLPCNHIGAVSLTGQFFTMPVGFDGDPAFTLDARGRSVPQVIDSLEQDTSPPFWKTTFGAARCWRVHTSDEIAFSAPLLPMGRFDIAKTYREGNIVDLADGSTWIYINAAATAGNAPPAPPATSNAWWSLRSQAYDASGLRYLDGTLIEDLQPSEPGSDVTSAVSGVAEITINADYLGAITTTLPKTQGYVLLKNGVDETTNATWSVSVTSGTIAASIGSATGVLSLNTSSGSLTNSVLTISAVLAGAERSLEVRVTKVLGAAPSTGGGGTGTSASGNVNGSTSTASMVAVGDELTVTTGSGGQVALSASYTFDNSSSGSYGEYAQWYWWNGSAYVTLGSEVAALQNWISATGEPGYGEITYTATGLGAGTSQKFRLYMRNSSGTVTRNITGSCSAVGS